MDAGQAAVERLLHSSEPSLRYKTLVVVGGADEASAEVRGLREAVAVSERVAAFLAPRRADGTLPYHPYQILFGLKVMAEAGFLADARCQDALDLLASKRLDDGGFPAEARYYTVSRESKPNSSPVAWGGTSRTRRNEWVTADALAVLRRAGRLGAWTTKDAEEAGRRGSD